MNLIVLKEVLARIDGETFETLEGRITFQKRVYLVQAAGLDLGYRFVWHQYGPYSSELARDGTSLEAGLVENVRLSEPLEFTKDAQLALESFERLANPPAALSEAAWLELLTSLHYLIEFDDPGLDLPALKKKLISAKPYFEEFEGSIDDAWERIHSELRQLV